jgi:iron(III) transport system ATP-binding protein
VEVSKKMVALSSKSNGLLMDDPFSNLDADLIESIREELEESLKKANMTCILVKHNRDDIKVIYDYSIVIGQSNDFQEKTTKYKITCIVKKA